MARNLTTVVSSATQTVEINREKPTVIIGERINPTGRKQVLAAFQAGDFEIACTDAIAQVAAGADMLDVNAGVPGADEPALLVQVLKTRNARQRCPAVHRYGRSRGPGSRPRSLPGQGSGQLLQRRGALAEARFYRSSRNSGQQ